MKTAHGNLLDNIRWVIHQTNYNMATSKYKVVRLFFFVLTTLCMLVGFATFVYLCALLVMLIVLHTWVFITFCAIFVIAAMVSWLIHLIREWKRMKV